MAKIKLKGHDSGTGVLTVTAPNTSTDRTITLPDATDTLAVNSDVTNKLPLAGGTMTGNLNIIQSTSGTGSSAVKELIYNEGAGDAALHLALSGSTDWYVGADNTDNSLKIGQASWDSSPYLAIDTTGAVTMPAQPAFQAKPSTDQNNIAQGADVTIIYGTEVFDQNSDFNSNVFTAPVTGKYQLNSYIRLNNVDTAPAYYQFKIKTSNRTYTTTYDTGGFSEDPAYYSFSHSVLADMDAGDTAYVAIHQHSAGTAQTDVDPETTFSGYLAC